jgi:hypothetical protein
MRSLLHIRVILLAMVTAVGAGAASTVDALEKYGIGVGIGDISGLSLYGRVDERRFYQALFASGDESKSFAVSVDYAISHLGALTDLPIVAPYYGFGGMVVKYPRWLRYRSSIERENALAIGGRIPLGLQMQIPKTPVQLSMEITPGILLTPATDVFVDALFAVRVVF